MKKVLLLSFIVSLFVGSASAQESTLKLVQEGRSWHTVSLMPTYNNTDYEGEENFYKGISGNWCKANSHNYCVIKGDTIINGKSYKKLLKDNLYYCCAMRQEQDKVYVYAEQLSPDEYILFDFGLNVGDEISLFNDEYAKMRVLDVQTVNVNGVDRRILSMSAYWDGFGFVDSVTDVWIEGIGCINGISSPDWWMAIGLQPLLVECCQDGEPILTYDFFTDKITPIYDSYQPFLGEGKRWNYIHDASMVNDGNTYQYSYFMEGDTAISWRYKKVYMEKDGEVTYVGAMRGDARGVNFIPAGDKTETVLYNFGLRRGGKMTLENGSIHITCKDVKREVFEGIERDVLYWIVTDGYSVNEIEEKMSLDNDYYDFFWIDGIGSTIDLLAPYSLPGNYNHLVSCERNGKIFYKSTTYNSNVHDIRTNSNVSSQIFDFSGRRLNSVPEKGMYIQGGKKWMVK